MKMAEIKNLIYRYKRYRDQKSEPETFTAIDGVSLSVETGDFVGIAGENGSGKSTLARQLCALLLPDDGKVLVFGRDTSDPDMVSAIRRSAGMVFQNPENQIIGATVEEDVAFGPENLGMEPGEMEVRIEKALASTGMTAYRMRTPGELSGGQKQKIAISGILAMEPDCIIFDEPAAMIDPASRKELGRIIRSLNRDKGITILYITHDLSEVNDADYLYVMRKGKISLEGKPGQVFSRRDELMEAGLTLPPLMQLLQGLREKGLSVPGHISRAREAADWLIPLLDPDRLSAACRKQAAEPGESKREEEVEGKSLLLSHVSWAYPGLKAEEPVEVVKDVSLRLAAGQMTALVGSVGTGKSTLLMLMDGLLVPACGDLILDGERVVAGGRTDPAMMKKLHRKVGFGFQNPDYQLFEETVLKDVEFGPANMGLSPEECETRAKEALGLTGLSEEDWDKSPFFLSGGQKRRAALAGLLAMEPDYLLLDEPAAGLDGRGREGLFSLLRRLAKERGSGVLFVSHDMDEAARWADRVLIMAEGKILADSPTTGSAGIMSDEALLKKAGLCLPQIADFMGDLIEKILPEADVENLRLPVRTEEAEEMILASCRGGEAT
ncbi:MAG: energy-coupling factor transporter ATPase [Eubacterium sp.]|nr:energy-coupling factor transporter ATPase [Eubacterium sp.]